MSTDGFLNSRPISMRILTILAALACLTASSARADEPGIAPTGTLRAVYIASNLAQAVQDPTTGTFRGVSADIARELGRRNQVPVTITPLGGAAAVLDAVRSGTADIGFVAPNPERMGVVLYSQTYMLVQQSFLVRDGSPIAGVADLDRPGRTIAVNTDDSVGVYLKSHLTQAKLIESGDYTLKEGARWLLDGTADAFGGNRQRLHASTADVPGLHLLPDNLYGVPQTIAVAAGKTELLAAINRAIDEMRESGFLKAAVERSGVDGIGVAPAEASQ
jgi:polar amino acid transport system substrate-binding protein